MATVSALHICTHANNALAAITFPRTKYGTIAIPLNMFTRPWRAYMTTDGECQFICAQGDRHTQSQNIRSAVLTYVQDNFINPLRIYNTKLIANCVVGCREPSTSECQQNPDDAEYVQTQFTKAKRGEVSVYNLWFLVPTNNNDYKTSSLVHCNRVAQAEDIVRALASTNAFNLSVQKDHDNAQLKPIELDMEQLKAGYSSILRHKSAKFPEKPTPVKLPVADTLNVLMGLSKILSEDVGDQQERILSMTTRMKALIAENEQLKRSATDQGELDGIKKEVKKLKKANATLQAALTAATSVEQSEEED